MGTWTISPTEGVTSSVTDNRITINFPRNTGSTDITYKIDYSDEEGCVAETKDFIVPAGQECQYQACTCERMNVNVAEEEITIEQNATTGETEISYDCEPTFSSNVSWIQNISIIGRDDKKYLTFICTHNDGMERNGSIQIKNENNETCLSITVKQKGCSCSQFTVTGETSIAYYEQTPALLASFNSPTCNGSITSSTNVAWVSNLSVLNGQIYGNVEANTSYTQSRNATLNLEWSGNELTCNTSTTITQDVCQNPRLKLTPSCNIYNSSHELIKSAGEPYIINQNGRDFYEDIYIERSDLTSSMISFELTKDDGIPGAVYVEIGNYPFVITANSSSYTDDVLCNRNGEPYSMTEEYMNIGTDVLLPSDDTEASSNWVNFDNGITFLSTINNATMFIPKNFSYPRVIALRFRYAPTVYYWETDYTTHTYNPVPAYKNDAIRVDLNIRQFF